MSYLHCEAKCDNIYTIARGSLRGGNRIVLGIFSVELLIVPNGGAHFVHRVGALFVFQLVNVLDFLDLL